ncbi:protein sidekick-2 [Lampetra fluviatilis]
MVTFFVEKKMMMVVVVVAADVKAEAMTRRAVVMMLMVLILLGARPPQCWAQDEVAPYFKTEPAPLQTHLEGNRLVLTCLAEGSWPLEFKWLFNGRELTGYSSEYRFVIASLDRSHAGFYQCVVRNRVGALLQRKTEIRVAYMGNFVEGEQKLSLPQGQAAALVPPAITGYPSPQVTWFREGRKISPSPRIAVTTENWLVVLASASSDGGRYFVQAVNEQNGENKTSGAVTLAVENGEGPADPIAPEIVVAPRNTSVNVGTSEVTLQCVANARPVARLSLVWRKDGVTLHSGISDWGRRLTVQNPGLGAAGVYECEAVLKGSSVAPASARAHLSIIEPPYLVLEPERHMVGEVESIVDIPCQAMGSPRPSLQWYKDAVRVGDLSARRYVVLPSGSLQIGRLEPDDTGIYQCVVSNQAGEVQTYTHLSVTSIAANITRGPTDTLVIEGHAIVLPCEALGAPRPSITWQKDGGVVLVSGSVQTARFTLLESGGLLVSPARLGDAGSYSCVATNSRGADSQEGSLLVLARTQITVPPQDRSVIKGTTAELTCSVTHDPTVEIRHVWEKDGAPLSVGSVGRVSQSPDGSLVIAQTWSGDIGTYACRVTSLGGNDSRSARLEVRELPHPPQNLRARQSEERSRALELSWVRPFDGNSPLIRYVVEISENNSPWMVHLSNVDPQATRLSLTGLVPSRTYRVRVCAINDVGRGQFSKETDRLTLPEEPPGAPPQNVIASGRTNQSIMIQWQPPPESQHNGALRGYVIRYRLAGLPADYQTRNITGAEVTTFLLEELIVWTNYELEVAAFNAAGLGPYCATVTEWTLQGVPTVTPENVRVVALSSTALKFTWFPPNPQFINGINQGYKLLAWPPDTAEEVTVVTVAPSYQAPMHEGVLTGLRKFTEYHAAVLCFTTPGDGPRSAARLVRTLQDRPGPVGRLSFSEILDTSLRVSWQEPREKNGVLIGYRISWEEHNRSDTRVTRSLPNGTLELLVTGLTALTTYTIEVSAATAAGQGPVSSSTISSGVPPELPGAPTNLAISNIGPRSAMLQFRAGYDGKTSISKWSVEAQVGVVGDSEEWLRLYELDNEPDARSLEIPNLTPFTHYRFRMKQTNIVGSSPASLPSRTMQTLQSPPDLAPANLTVRTASETSLWLRWVPLPELEYNALPESVGYRVRYTRLGVPPWGPLSTAARPGDAEPWAGVLGPRGEAESGGGGGGAGGGAEPALFTVVADRLEREVTLEGLEEWSEYRLQMQAFNSIGPGPWSPEVRGRTRESVPSAGPVAVTANATTPTRITVSWGPVPEAEQNGLILGYKVLYQEVASERESDRGHGWAWPEGRESQGVAVVRGNATLSAALAQLLKYTLYEVRVQAFTRIGDGQPSSPPLVHRTLDDVPGPPVGILFPEVSRVSARLVWQPPTEPNGIILGYRVGYRVNGSSLETVQELDPSERQLRLTGLRPEALYAFRVTARTRKGWGLPAELTLITTQRRERAEPPGRPEVPQSGVWARSVLLTWVPGSDGLAPTRYYTVQGREVPLGRWETHHTPVAHNATEHVIDRLRPFTSYAFRLMATNDVGDSDFSPESEAVTTLQAVPSEAPVIVSITPHTTTSVLVRWKAPPEESVNGILLGFRVHYRPLQLYDAPPRLPPGGRRARDAVAAAAELTPRYLVHTLNDSSSTQHELENLTKYLRYEVRVTGYNVMGDGPPSPPYEVFVGEAVPTAPPQNVQVVGSTATQLELSWEPPPQDKQNGDIQGYKAYCWETARGNASQRVKTLFLPETSIKLRRLSGYTEYALAIAAFNAAGDGPRSAPLSAWTDSAAPSAPGALSFSEVTTSSVNVSWAEPAAPNGIIDGYRLVYEPSTPIDGVSKIVTVEIRGEGPRWLKVKDLVEGVTYHFRVRARTFTYGPEVDGNVTTGPGKGAPGPPGEPSVTRSGGSIVVHWTAGEPGDGPITGYVIETRASDEGLWDMVVRDVPGDARSAALSIDTLRRGISYDFRVIAHNALGFGAPSVPSPSVSAQMGAAFYEEWWFLVVVALTSLILILLLVFVLIIRGQNQKYSRKSDSSSTPRAGANEEITSLEGGFTTLELNNRRLSVKTALYKRNGTYARSPPRPSPGTLRYSDEDLTAKYEVTAAESSSLTEKPSELSESEASEEDDFGSDPVKCNSHSFVNHYMSEPGYYSSWRRQPKGLSRSPQPCGPYLADAEHSESGDRTPPALTPSLPHHHHPHHHHPHHQHHPHHPQHGMYVSSATASSNGPAGGGGGGGGGGGPGSGAASPLVGLFVSASANGLGPGTRPPVAGFSSFV